MRVLLLTQVAFLTISLALTAPIGVGNGNSSVVVNTEEQLQEALLNAEAGQSIEFNFTAVNLTSTLAINTSWLVLSGARTGSTLRCPQRGNALKVHASIHLMNIELADCRDAAAIFIKPRAQDSTNITVRCTNVRFRRNRLKAKSTGGGIEARGQYHGQLALYLIPYIHLERCHFSDNKADRGGALFCNLCAVNITSSSFYGNVANDDGGSINMDKDHSTLSVWNSTFEGNVAKFRTGKHATASCKIELTSHDLYKYPMPVQGGGAISTQFLLSVDIVNCTFVQNQAPTGGALFLKYKQNRTMSGQRDGPQIVRVSNCRFEGNKADVATVSSDVGTESANHEYDEEIKIGGAISVLSDGDTVDISLSDSIFVDNSAYHAGAMQLLMPQTATANISRCTFARNAARGSGGALWARHVGGIYLQASNFTSNTAKYGGGVMIASNAKLTAGEEHDDEPHHPSPKDHSCYFTNNSATDGGALAAVDTGDVYLYDVVFRNNAAERIGGGILVRQTRSQIHLDGPFFQKNTAHKGGGAAFIAAINVQFAAKLHQYSASFIRNTAVDGAGMFLKARNRIQNKITIHKVFFKENQAIDYQRFTPSTDGNDGAAPSTDCGNGGGGGLCLVLDSVPLVAFVDILINETSFVGNRALVGAGAFVEIAGKEWNKHNNGMHCPEPSPSKDPCKLFRVQNLAFWNNQAKYGGGGMHTTDPSKIILSCPTEDSTTNALTLLSIREANLSTCIHFQNNTVEDSGGSFGPNISTSAFCLQIVDLTNPITNLRSGARILPPCEECDPKRPPSVQAALMDAFNQTITGGISDSSMHVTIASENVIGEQIYKAKNGVVYMDETRAIGIDCKSNLTLKVVERTDLQAVLNFTTRPCYPGEVKINGECIACDPNSYSLKASVDCKECIPNAECRGNASLIPRDAYWHSSPFSTQFHKCISKEACVYENRNKKLAQYYTSSDQMVRDIASLDRGSIPINMSVNYNQCAEGYKGVLCGSCTKGYGHFAGGKCVKCPERRHAVWYTLLVLALILFLISFHILANFSSTGKRIRIAKAQYFRRQTLAAISFKRKDDESLRQPLLSVSNDSASEREEEIQECQIQGDQSKEEEASIENREKIDHIIALEKLTETLKILINYFQVTSTALSIDASWLYTVKLFLSIQSLFVGIMSGSTMVPLDCAFVHDDGSTPKSIVAFLLRICVPVILLIFFLLLVQISFFFSRKNIHKENKVPAAQNNGSKVTYSIVVALVLFYYFYIDLTSEFMRTANCILVDSEEDGVLEYNQYSIAKGKKYWAEDTDLICFESQHLVTMILGGFGFALFSIGLVIFLGIWILANRHRVRDPIFVARYGFMYFRYNANSRIALVWESVVFIRKALIAMIVVFAIQLRATLQSVLALGVLGIALAAHLVIRPFNESREGVPNIPISDGNADGYWASLNRKITLNTLDSVSMLCSISFFYTGIVVHDSNSSEAGRYFITVFALILNSIFVLFTIYRIYAAAVIVVDMHIELFKPPGVEFQKGCMSPIRFAANVFRLCRYFILKHRAYASSSSTEDVDSAV